MSLTPNYLSNIPIEIQYQIFSYLPLKDLFALTAVNKKYKNYINNEFFQNKCKESFQFLVSIPQFYDPLINTVNNPWKWIYVSLSGIKKSESFYIIAEQVAQASEDKFKSYLLGFVQSHQSALEENLTQKTLIDSKTHQALKFYKENWTSEDQSELNSLGESINSTDPSNQNQNQQLAYWQGQIKEIWETRFFSKEKIEQLSHGIKELLEELRSPIDLAP